MLYNRNQVCATLLSMVYAPNLDNDRSQILQGSYRHGPLNEAHDSTFGIPENYHCRRFHGSGFTVALQIIG